MCNIPIYFYNIQMKHMQHMLQHALLAQCYLNGWTNEKARCREARWLGGQRRRMQLGGAPAK
jgi:hypothetical protein